MDEFLKENYSLITKLVEIIAATVGLFCFKKFKNTPIKFFIYFLVYVVFVELIGGYTVYVDKYSFLKYYKEALKGTLIQRNFWWYSTFWTIGSVLFFTFYYGKIITSEKFRNIIKWSRVVFVLSAIGYILIVRRAYFTSFNPYLSVTAALVIMLCIVLYFIEILNSERIIRFYNSMSFYISVALLIWHLVLTPLVFYNVYFTTSDWSFVLLKWQIYLFTNIFMYSCFSIGFLFSKPQSA